MEKHNVLVTSIGGISVGNSIAKALCSTKRYNIFSTDINPLSSGLFLSKKGYIVPPASDSKYIKKLIEICRECRAEAIFPGHEAEIKVISDNRERFEEEIQPMINSRVLIDKCFDKFEQASFLSSKRIKSPKTVFLDNSKELVDEFGFPLVIKAATVLGGGGSKSVYIVKDKEELDFYKKRGEQLGTKLILQEYIGSTTAEYTIGVITSKKGKMIDSIIMHRGLVGPSKREVYRYGKTTYGTSSGISQGIFEDNPQVQKAAEEIALKVGSCGPLNIQARLVDDELVVFELNPRFSASTSMRAGVGFNDPDIVFRNFVLGEEFGRLNYQKNIAAMRALVNIFVPLDKFNSLTEKGMVENIGGVEWKFW